jgi:hypothetical protein
VNGASVRALVTNDDGIDSPGLLVLAKAAHAAGLDVVVAAPARQSSGASAAITAVRREGRTLVEHGEVRHARLAEFGTVQARVDEVDDGSLRLGEIEVGGEPEEGTDSALLGAGHPTLTALRSVTEDDSVDLLPERLSAAGS